MSLILSKLHVQRYCVHSAAFQVTLNLLTTRLVSFVGPQSTVRLGAGPQGMEPWLKTARVLISSWSTFPRFALALQIALSNCETHLCDQVACWSQPVDFSSASRNFRSARHTRHACVWLVFLLCRMLVTLFCLHSSYSTWFLNIISLFYYSYIVILVMYTWYDFLEAIIQWCASWDNSLIVRQSGWRYNFVTFWLACSGQSEPW